MIVWEPAVDVNRELREFDLFAKANPNAKLHVKRWNKTIRSYEFGWMLVSEGMVHTTVYIPTSGGKNAQFGFDSLTQVLAAGWIGD